MVQNKKARNFTKSVSTRAKFSTKKVSSKKSSFLSRFKPQSRKGAIKLALALIGLIVIAGAIPLPHTFAKSAALDFATENKNYAGLELGDSKVLREGRDGRKVVNIKSLHSMWGRLFGLDPIRQKEVNTTIIEAPVDKIVANGSNRYQYMLCSDAGYKYYTDQQMKDEKVGFTNKSEDDCAKSNKGHRIGLTNTNPETKVNNLVSGADQNLDTGISNEAQKIDRETARLKECARQSEYIFNEYMQKYYSAKAEYDSVIAGGGSEEGATKAYNSLIDAAYFRYSYLIKSQIAIGCSEPVVAPNYSRR